MLYLAQADYDLDRAIQKYRDDDRWEKEHPLQVHRSRMGKTVAGRKTTRPMTGGGLVGQLS